MPDDEVMDELYRIKEELSLKYKSAHDLGAAVHQYCVEHPLRPAGPHRKMIDGFPRGQSVADEDEIMRELYQAKEQIAAKFGNDIHKMAEAYRASDRKQKATGPKPQKRKPSAPFRRDAKTKK